MSTGSFTIEGDPGSVEALADGIGATATAYEQSEERISLARPSSWQGVAADAYDESRRSAVQRYGGAAVALQGAARELLTYATVLRRAQAEAARAAGTYQRGEALTVQAQAEYEAQVAAARTPRAVQVIPPFSDPGEQLRQQALSAVAAAREEVATAAAVAAAGLRAAAAVAPRAAGQFGQLGGDAGGSGGGGGTSRPPWGTSAAVLKERLDRFRAAGLHPSEYAGLLQQYWATVAAERAGIDIGAWDPSAGAEANRATIEQVYSYYGQLFVDHPYMQWAGMANAVGPSFAGGFYDLGMLREYAGALDGQLDELPGPARAALPPQLQALSEVSQMSASELEFYETTLLGMQREIFVDQAGMHEAYLSGGLGSLREMEQAGLVDQKTVRAWDDIQTGQTAGDDDLIARGNQDLLRREQYEIIRDDYKRMYSHSPSGPAFTYAMTAAGAPSVPGAHSFGEVMPLEFPVTTPGPERLGTPDSVVGVDVPDVSVDNPGQFTASVSTPLPDGNVAHFEDRWALIERDTWPAYQELVAEHPEQAREIASTPVSERISEARLQERLDDLVARHARGWNVAVEQ